MTKNHTPILGSPQNGCFVREILPKMALHTPLEINMLHIIMEVWKMIIFLPECVIFRFHVNYSRVYSTKKKQGANTHLFVRF